MTAARHRRSACSRPAALSIGNWQRAVPEHSVQALLDEWTCCRRTWDQQLDTRDGLEEGFQQPGSHRVAHVAVPP